MRTWLTYDLLYDSVKDVPEIAEMEIGAAVSMFSRTIDDIMTEVGGELAKQQYILSQTQGKPDH